MAISIKSPETDRLARQLAAATGETITVAITIAMRQRLDLVERKRRNKAALLEEIQRLAITVLLCLYWIRAVKMRFSVTTRMEYQHDCGYLGAGRHSL